MCQTEIIKNTFGQSQIRMEAKFELVTSGVNELEEKIVKAQKLLSDLKTIVHEINNSQISITLKP